MKLVASLATRGRPQQMIETLKRHMACLSRPDTKMIVQADADDLATVTALSAAELDPRVSVNVKPREDTIAAKWNRGLSEPADIYLCAADDDPYVTMDLDGKIIKAAETQLPEDRIGMIYGRMANASFPGVIAYTAQWAQAFGYLQPEHFPYWFADHWTDDLGRIIGRIAFADVTTDQSKAGKTQELREPWWWATWFDAGYLHRRSVAHKVINSVAFEAAPWHKTMLLAHHPLIEFRSRWVNETVRGQSKQLEGMSGLTLKDARYQRSKQAAIAMLPHLLDDYGMDKREADAFREALTPPDKIVSLPRAYG